MKQGYDNSAIESFFDEVAPKVDRWNVDFHGHKNTRAKLSLKLENAGKNDHEKAITLYFDCSGHAGILIVVRYDQASEKFIGTNPELPALEQEMTAYRFSRILEAFDPKII